MVLTSFSRPDRRDRVRASWHLMRFGFDPSRHDFGTSRLPSAFGVASLVNWSSRKYDVSTQRSKLPCPTGSCQAGSGLRGRSGRVTRLSARPAGNEGRSRRLPARPRDGPARRTRTESLGPCPVRLRGCRSHSCLPSHSSLPAAFVNSRAAAGDLTLPGSFRNTLASIGGHWSHFTESRSASANVRTPAASGTLRLGPLGIRGLPSGRGETGSSWNRPSAVLPSRSIRRGRPLP
jgi:hypothetical protein